MSGPLQARFVSQLPALSRSRRRGMGDPWGFFDSIANDLQVFRDTFDSGDLARQSQQLSFNTDMVEQNDCYEYISDLPGVTKDEIDLSIKNGVLEIRTHRANAHEQKSEPEQQQQQVKAEGGGKAKRQQLQQQELPARLHMQERFYGEFVRRFQLPDDVDLDLKKVQANYKDGVLKIKVPKTEKSRAMQQHKIAIQ
jgi:HSP20 family protein